MWAKRDTERGQGGVAKQNEVTPSSALPYLQDYGTLPNHLVIQTTDAGGHQVSLPVEPCGLTWKLIIFSCGGGGGGLPSFPGEIPLPLYPYIKGEDSILNSGPSPMNQKHQRRIHRLR